MDDSADYAALYSYRPRRPDELQITRGQGVVVIERHDVDGDEAWWKVCLATNSMKSGYVPALYLTKKRRLHPSNLSTRSDEDLRSSRKMSTLPLTSLLSSDELAMNEEVHASIFNVPQAATTAGLKAAVETTRVSRYADATNDQTKYIYEELLETERNYVNSLETIVSVFMKPLEDCFIKSQHLRAIFSEIPTILKFTQTLLQELEQCREYQSTDSMVPVSSAASSSSSQNSVVDVMLCYVDFLKLYAPYVENFDVASSTLEKLQKQNKRFRHFLKQCEDDPACMQLPLESFLIMPVQRPPRYKLLVQELMKYARREDEAFSKLEQLKQKLFAVETYINTKTKDLDARRKLTDLSIEMTRPWRFHKNLTSPSRWFISEYTVYTLKTKNLTRPLKRTLVLCNDCLFMTRESKLLTIRRKPVLLWTMDLRNVKTICNTPSSTSNRTTEQIEVNEVTTVLLRSSAQMLQISETVFPRFSFFPPQIYRRFVAFENADMRASFLHDFEEAQRELLALEKHRINLVKAHYRKNYRKTAFQQFFNIHPWWEK